MITSLNPKMIADIIKTVGELSVSRYCEDGGVRLSYESVNENDFKLLGREIIRRFNAKMRRFSEEDLEFVAEVNGIYVMIYLHNCPTFNELRPWVFSIILREDLDDFGEECDDVEKLHNLFK